MYHRFKPLFALCQAIEAVKAIEEMEDTTDLALRPLQAKLDFMCNLWRVTPETLWKEYAEYQSIKDGLRIRFFMDFANIEVQGCDIDFSTYVMMQYMKYERSVKAIGGEPMKQYEWEREVALKTLAGVHDA